jgi:dihydropteroate synthase
MTSNTSFRISRFIQIKGHLHDFSNPKIMGILNMTPDSFYEKSRKSVNEDLISTVSNMIQAGADIIDIGASSTRPGAETPSASEEISRLQDVFPLLRQEFPEIILSIDTFYGEVAEFALTQGADIVNDISGGQFDPEIWNVVAKLQAPYVLTYHRGEKSNAKTSYVSKNFMMDVLRYFSEKISELEKRGVYNIILDPGFGFGKSLEENYELIRSFDMLHLFEKPIMVGISRKSMIRDVLDVGVEDSLNGSSVLHTLLLAKNAQVFRVHDVPEMNEVRTLMRASQ